MARKTGDPAAPRYAIATVARLTGIDAHTIRAWERRHRAVAPRRTESGQRRYGEAEVARLQLLKAVVDAGEPIGQVAGLPDGALQARIAKLAAVSAAAPPSTRPDAPLALALLAPGLARQIEGDATARASLHVSVSARDVRSLLRALASERADVVVVELHLLGGEPQTALRAIVRSAKARLVLVVYQFAPARELARLRRLGARLARGPLRADALRQTIHDLLAARAAESAPRPRAARAPRRALGAPARRFDDVQLARLLEIPSGIQCECPSHLAALIASVGEFERYSRECESRSPEDASLHRTLAEESGSVRAALERMLVRVCEHEGLPF